MIRFHTIRGRLTFWYTSLVAATLIISGFVSYLLTRDSLYDALDQSLKNEVIWLKKFVEPRAQEIPPRHVIAADTLAASPFENELILSREQIWNEVFRHTLLNPHQLVIQILDRNGDPLYQTPVLNSKPLPIGSVPRNNVILKTIEDDSGRELRLAMTQTEYLKVMVAYPLDDIQQILGNVITIRLFLSPISILIALLGGLALAHRLLKPVDDLARAAENITAQNLNVTLPVGSSQDEVSRLTKTFNEMISRLHDSFSQIQQFSAEASHELRTPLTIMRGEIEISLRNSRFTKQGRELLTSIHDELVRLSSIVENLMTLVKSGSGRLTLQLRDVSLDTLLSEVADDLRVLAGEKKIKVRVMLPEPVTLSGDPQRLRQLFLNLIDNAVKFTPSNGSITLSLEQQNGRAVVSVKDTGVGIPRKDREKIFARFYRARRSDSSDMAGSGLGLSIAKWIAEAHNGTIQVKSREKSGSTFLVSLPLTPPHRSS